MLCKELGEQSYEINGAGPFQGGSNSFVFMSCQGSHSDEWQPQKERQTP